MLKRFIIGMFKARNNYVNRINKIQNKLKKDIQECKIEIEKINNERKMQNDN